MEDETKAPTGSVQDWEWTSEPGGGVSLLYQALKFRGFPFDNKFVYNLLYSHLTEIGDEGTPAMLLTLEQLGRRKRTLEYEERFLTLYWAEKRAYNPKGIGRANMGPLEKRSYDAKWIETERELTAIRDAIKKKQPKKKKKKSPRAKPKFGSPKRPKKPGRPPKVVAPLVPVEKVYGAPWNLLDPLVSKRDRDKLFRAENRGRIPRDINNVPYCTLVNFPYDIVRPGGGAVLETVLLRPYDPAEPPRGNGLLLGMVSSVWGRAFCEYQ